MHAWQFDHYGHYSENLHWVERPMPTPGFGEALVRTRAVSLNFPDLLIVQGMYQHKAPLPAVPGVEGVGIVEAVGPGSKFKVGDRAVGFCHGGGTLADCFLVHNHSAWTVPAHVTDEQAAALSVTYGTSYFGLYHRAHLKPGETLLVLGAAGGVGTAAIQIAKAAGAKVIAAASTDDKCALCKELGADATINYSTDNLRDALKALTGGKGPDVVYDPVGGDFAEPAFRSIAWLGRYLIIGFAGGPIPALPLNLPLLKGASLVGVFWGDFARREPQANAAMMAELAQWYGQGKIKPVIDRAMPMRELKAAYAHMGSRGVKGKLVMVN